MKLLFTMMILVFSTLNIQSYAQGVRFEQNFNWEQLKEKAKTEDKLIFLDVYATWCGPCKKMDKEVYTNDSLGNYVNSKFISAKIQMDSTAKDNEGTKSNYAFAKKICAVYNISVLPTFLFFDSKGNLVHRDDGLYPANKFKQICQTAVNPSKNHSGVLNDFYSGNIKGSDLLKLAKQLKHFKEDALALEVAKKFRLTVLDQKKPKEALNQDVIDIFGYFPEVYNRKDSLIRYIFQHQTEADQLMVSPGYSKRLIDYYVMKEMIFSKIQDQNHTPIAKIPSWSNIQRNVAEEWDEGIAKRTILKGKIWYYAKKKDYANQIKYEIEQVELNGLPLAEDGWGAAGLNNMVYSVIFKHSNDPYALKKAAEYMSFLTKNYPKDHANMDTYANILYKSGQKEKALELERKALMLADQENNKEDADLYTEVIKKMERNVPTWK